MKVISFVVCSFFLVGSIELLASVQKEFNVKISGQVFDPLGTPIEKAYIKVLSGERKLAAVATNRQGYYEVRGLPHGEVIIVVEYPGFHRLKKQIVLRDVQEILDFELEVGLVSAPPDFEITGLVHQPGNSPLNNAVVSIIDPFTQKLISETRADITGKYSLHVYRVGQYIVYASKPGFKTSAHTVVLQRNESINFVLLRLVE